MLQIVGGIDAHVAATGVTRSELVDQAVLYFYQRFRTSVATPTHPD